MLSHPRSHSKTASDTDRHKDVVRSPTRKFDLRLILGRGTYTTFPALPDLCPLIPVNEETVSPQIIPLRSINSRIFVSLKYIWTTSFRHRV